MTHEPSTPDELRAAAVELRARGYGIDDVGQVLHLSREAVAAMLTPRYRSTAVTGGQSARIGGSRRGRVSG